MKALVVAAALVAFGALPALAEGGCSYSSGKQQTVKVETQSQTQTASTQQSVPSPESAQ